MAIISADKNYLKISHIDFRTNNVVCDLFESEAHRISGDDDFKKKKTQEHFINDVSFDRFSYDSEKGLVDSIKTYAYVELLKLPEFENWTSKI
jgi:hypothetical protein